MEHRKTIRRVLPYLVLAAAYVFTIGVYALVGEYGLNADISSEMVLADLLNEEGALITPNWYYSTELRVISPVPAYQLGLMLFADNWHAAHTFGLGLALLCAALAIVYLGRGVGHGGAAALAAAVLILPVSEVQNFLFSAGGFYTAYITLSCLLIGLLLRLPCARRKGLYLAVLAALSFVGGLSGVRMPMICVAPLAMACALEAFAALRRAASLREMAGTPQAQMAAGVVWMAAFMLAGYLVNAKVLAGTYHFFNYDEIRLGALELSGVLTQAQWILQFFGYRPDVPFMSTRGICNVLITGVFVLMAACLIHGLIRRRERTAQERVLLYFAACALALGVFLNVTMGEVNNRYSVGYYLMGIFALALLAFMALARMRCRMQGLRTLSMLSLGAVFALQALVFTTNYMPDTPLQYEAAAQWLLENGYQTGYSTFWNGNVLTEISDGQIDLIAYHDWTQEEPTPWLQRTDHFGGQPEGKVFAYVGGDELAAGLPFMTQQAAWEDGYAKIYTYESADELQALLAAWRAGLPEAAAESIKSDGR